VYRNDIQVGFVTAGGDGVFAIGISLEVGINSLKASTGGDCHPPAYSNVVTVEREAASTPPGPEPTPGLDQDGYTPPPPNQPGGGGTSDPGASGQPGPSDTPKEQPPAPAGAPVILQPRNGVRVRQPFVLLVGQTSPRTTVRILRNDQVVAETLSDDQGKFTVRVPLEPGVNRLMIAAGPLFSETVIVTYEPFGPNNLLMWFFWGLLASAGLISLAILMIWQPVLIKRGRTLLRRRKR